MGQLSFRRNRIKIWVQSRVQNHCDCDLTKIILMVDRFTIESNDMVIQTEKSLLELKQHSFFPPQKGY